MKRIWLGLAACFLVLIVTLAVFIKPILIFTAKKELKRIFSATAVSIEDCRIDGLHEIKFLNVAIRISKYYALKADEIDVYFIGIALKEVGGTLEANGKDLIVQHGFLNLENIHRPGNLTIATVQYDKLKIYDVKSIVRVEGKDIFLDSSSGRLLDGVIKGKAHVMLGDDLQYLIELTCADLGLPGFVRDYELKEKVELTGTLSGKVTLSGKMTLNGVKLNMLNGILSTKGREGTVVINDTRMLENLAHSLHQPTDIVVESFKDYHYNMGIVNLSLDRDGNLNANIAMNGEKGKRDFQVILHDVGLKTKRRW
jgi:hypothetical protein